MNNIEIRLDGLHISINIEPQDNSLLGIFRKIGKVIGNFEPTENTDKNESESVEQKTCSCASARADEMSAEESETISTQNEVISVQDKGEEISVSAQKKRKRSSKTCAQCGESFEGGANSKLCESCRSKKINKERDPNALPRSRKLICDNCCTEFYGYNYTKFCSDECKNEATVNQEKIVTIHENEDSSEIPNELKICEYCCREYEDDDYGEFCSEICQSDAFGENMEYQIKPLDGKLEELSEAELEKMCSME